MRGLDHGGPGPVLLSQASMARQPGERPPRPTAQCDLLENPIRRRLLRMVCQKPGASRSELTAMLGVARGTVDHHLAILRRAGLVQEHRRGKIPVYTFSPRGEPGHPRGTARPMSDAIDWVLLRHPIRRGLVLVLRDIGPASATTIRTHWARLVDGQAPRPAKVSLHAGLLKEVGILSREARGREVLWHLRTDPHELARRGIEEALNARQAHAVLRRVRDASGMSAEDLVASLGPGWTKDRTLQELRWLYAAGLLDFDGKRFVVPGSARTGRAAPASAQKYPAHVGPPCP